jgi:transglutaminase-like putative cysteine protease
MVLVARTNGIQLPGRDRTAVAVDRFFDLALLGLLASGYFAVLGSGYLDIPTAAIVAAGLLLRGLGVTGLIRFDLSKRRATVLALASLGFYPLDYFFLSRGFLAATVHLVFFLAIVKLLAARATRDSVFVGVVAFLELLAASVLSSGLNFLVFLALFVAFAAATFASAEIRRAMRKPGYLAHGGRRRIHWRLAALTLSIALGILAIAGGLFFLLPRTAQAAMQQLEARRYSIPGFSNEMRLGETGEIQQRGTAVMHVRFFDSERPPEMKWRGNALAQFDGKRWYNTSQPERVLRVQEGLLKLSEDNSRSYAAPRGASYEVQLSSAGSDALFFAGRPRILRINVPLVIEARTGGYRLGFGSTDGLHYGVYSAFEESEDWELPAAERREYLELPRLDGRIAALARAVAGGGARDRERAQTIASYLRTHYRYTTALPSSEPADPLGNFLFERRAGHCEYFASAMAVMLRAIGIPARVATGFAGGVFNPVSGWYVVRASDAHSWVEAWLPGHGWTTFDPTPVDPNSGRLSAGSRLSFYLDAADTFWQEWVLSYNLDRQLTLASRMQDSGFNASTEWFDSAHRKLVVWTNAVAGWGRRYGPTAGLALAAIALAMLYGRPAVRWLRALVRVRQVERGDVRASDATLLYGQMLKLLKKRGFEKPAWLTPSEFARLLPRTPAGMLAGQFTEAYNGLRYGGRSEAAPRLLALLRELERS